MAIVLHCPCGRKLQIKDEHAGQEGQCPACGRTLAIPRAGDGVPLPSMRPVAVARTVEPPPIPPLPPRAASRLRADEEEAAPSDLRDIPNHGDGPLPIDADFFAPAPHAIGPLLSARTSLREGKRPLNPVRVL